MSGYTKLFSSIVASTIWRADDAIRLVWITMLAMADKNGIVEASVPGLADLARVSVDECRRAIGELGAPDTDSRSKEHEGRRILEVDGGWLLVNHAKYRAKLSAEDRREYKRKKAIEYRAREKRGQRVDTRSAKWTESTHTEAEASPDPKAEAEDQERKTAPRSTTSTPTILTFPTVGASHSWPLSQKHLDSWGEAYPALDVLGECRRALAWVQAKSERRKTAKGMPAFLVNWFNRSTDRGGHARIHDELPMTKAQRSSQAIDQAFDSLERVHAARETERHGAASQSLEVALQRPAGPRGR